MSFLSALFGRGAAKTQPASAAAKTSEPLEYKGFVICAAPFASNGQFQTAGLITREIGGVVKEHRFIRADAYAVYEDAVNFSLGKARQIIDLQGERLFNEA